MNGMFYSRTGCQVKTSLRTELVLPKESGPTVVTVTKSPLLLMSQIFSNDSGALILMKYDNPAQSWFRTQDPLNTRRCNSSWSVSLQDLPCRMNEINFYINEEISMTTRTDDTPFKSVKHRFATLPPSRSKTVEKFSCFKKIRLNIIYTLISVEFITTRNRNKISLSTK
jgi:hypothetical protein